jgi:hypothetical protein
MANERGGAYHLKLAALLAAGETDEARALARPFEDADSRKVDELIAEGRTDEALMLARQFGNAPHDIQLRKEQLQQIRDENAARRPGVTKRVRSENGKHAGHGNAGKARTDWHVPALAWAVELRETFPAHYKSAFAPTIISGWPGRVAGVDSPGDRELKDFLSVCESDGRLKPRQITKKKRI